MNIRGVDPDLWKWLRVEAVQNDRPMGQELNEVLREMRELRASRKAKER